MSQAGTHSDPQLPARGFWRTHLVLPLLLFALLLLAVKATSLDFIVADSLFDAVAGTFPARDARLFRDLLHDGGNLFVRTTAILAAALALAGCVVTRLRPWRRAAAYVLLSIAVTAGFAAAGKRLTNMDCPWSLTRYGGERPYVGLFEARPEALPRGECFPGAHSAGAFALFAFYFVWRGTRPRRARLALSCVVALGLAFAATQWARGAHFVSHDLASALLAWLVCLGLYAAFGFRLLPPAPAAG